MGASPSSLLLSLLGAAIKNEECASMMASSTIDLSGCISARRQPTQRIMKPNGTVFFKPLFGDRPDFRQSFTRGADFAYGGMLNTTGRYLDGSAKLYLASNAVPRFAGGRLNIANAIRTHAQKMLAPAALAKVDQGGARSSRPAWPGNG